MEKIGTFDGVNIRKGVTNSPSVAIPANANFMGIEVGRENWPAAGVDIWIAISHDGGITFNPVCGATKIMPHIATAREPNPTPASIGYGWGGRKRPTHIKACSNSPNAFSAKIVVKVG